MCSTSWRVPVEPCAGMAAARAMDSESALNATAPPAS